LLREEQIRELLSLAASQLEDQTEQVHDLQSKIASTNPIVSPEVAIQVSTTRAALEVVARREAAVSRTLEESMATVLELKQQLSRTSQAVAAERQQSSVQDAALKSAIQQSEMFRSQQHAAHEQEIQVLNQNGFVHFFHMRLLCFCF